MGVFVVIVVLVGWMVTASVAAVIIGRMFAAADPTSEYHRRTRR